MPKITCLPVLGVASANGGPSGSCALGPAVIKNSSYASLLQQVASPVQLEWQPILEVATHQRNSLNTLKKQSCVINQFCAEQFERRTPFIVIGGDHSCGIGTWSGVLNQLPSEATFALIWIDAHMDAHTLETSLTGNLHGMPVSVILGEADHRLQNCFPGATYLDGRDLYLFGIRSFESDELVLLSRKKVNVFDTDRINRDGGTVKVLSQLIETIARCYDYFAISLDLDAIDPEDAPGVETREVTGIRAERLLEVFRQMPFHEKFVGLEIAEFDPQHDVDHKTEKLVYDIIAAVFAE